MRQNKPWRRLPLVCAGCLIAASVMLAAQNQFAKDYVAAEAAYKDRDLNTAEQMFLASLRSQDSPKNSRGAKVRLVSRQFGYYPEVFLTLIYQEERRYSDVLSYAARAKRYLKSSDPRYSLVVKAEDESTRALANLPPNRPVTWLRSGVVDSKDPVGGMFAMVIAVNQYDDSALPRLSTAIADGVAITTVLHDRYGFETTFLPAASRTEILSAMDKYQSLSETSSLLIYYAGHGDYDRAADTGYWLPRDARKAGRTDYIQAAEITDRIRAIPARHILLISDSCYSGRFTRSPGDDSPPYTGDDRELFVRREAAARSRNLMSSGFDEPVSDLGGEGEHSVFAAALLRGLGSVDMPSFTAGELFQKYVLVPVTARAPQRPQYIPIQGADPGPGDFVFYRAAR
jgi:hypothetical protein